jgi:hypothetical protein
VLFFVLLRGPLNWAQQQPAAVAVAVAAACGFDKGHLRKK